ncbi:MAG: asparaginase [Acidobacteria bacterium]|nr:asparaginase [Acidobacteriota bacterium]
MGTYTDHSAGLIEVTRGALVEALHRGVIAVIDGQGCEHARVGDVSLRTWFRSAAKPFQTLALVAGGAADQFGLTASELAVITGSHSGEGMHLAAVNSILKKIGMPDTALLCGAHMPFDDDAAKQLRAAGRAPEVLHNNCSGKHAGMLAFCRQLGEPVENYIDPEHPIQRRIREAIARFARVETADIDIAIDGCSAPVFGLRIEAMARSYARLVSGRGIEAPEAAAAARVVKSMIEHPEMVGGNRKRLDTELMRVTRGGLISKVGAEGVQLLGVMPNDQYPDGLGIAIKIEDGDIRRARDPVVIETLRQLGVLNEDQLEALSGFTKSKLFNHRGIEVGEIRTCFTLLYE